MPLSKPKAVCQLLAWYEDSRTGRCRIVPMEREGDELVACPTEHQQGLIIYPEDDPCNAGTFFASNGGQLFNLN
jgi:hypothetical protein